MLNPQQASVDVAISAYGKPYQTAVTLFTLLKHSGQWIDKVYFIEEKQQPGPVDFSFIYKQLGPRLVHYKPLFWFWYNRPFRRLMKLRPYRRAVRYQYAWEKTDKDYLLLIHNDVYFKDDLVEKYLQNIGDHAGVGKIGQCWNCPAFAAQHCNGDTYQHYRPSMEELLQLAEQFPGPRTGAYQHVVDKENPWPLPECRLNEYVGMVNMKHARKATLPKGTVTPFGIHQPIDTGVKWFSEMNQLGHTFANFNYDPYATHSWVSLKNAGHDAMFNKELYDYEESVALQCLKDEFGYQP